MADKIGSRSERKEYVALKAARQMAAKETRSALERIAEVRARSEKKTAHRHTAAVAASR